MSTIWDQAVRALRPVFEEVDARRDPLAYYCGGPVMVCAHQTCRVVSALAEADLLSYGLGGVDGLGETPIRSSCKDAPRADGSP